MPNPDAACDTLGYVFDIEDQALEIVRSHDVIVIPAMAITRQQSARLRKFLGDGEQQVTEFEAARPGAGATS